jgi:hypothetical protein
VPCYTVQTSAVVWQKVNLERMAAVLTEQGWQADLYGSKLVAVRGAMRMVLERDSDLVQLQGIASETEHLAALKRAYAAKTVKDVSAKYGWRVEATEQSADTITMKLGKR